ncbi:MAG: hypothetical protein KDC98_22205, partial [Planctomycetes bacterium]|nr:hypothetical protein [Planctomycetota bacterium]
TTALVPPAPLPAPDAAAVAAGRRAAVARRCTACHTIADPELGAVAPPPPAKAWHDLRGSSCPVDARAVALIGAVRSGRQKVRDARAQLDFALLRDGCLKCHVRDGSSGLPPAARRVLVQIEDLGEEGRLPPDLTGVGRRLRRDWIADVIGAGRRVRPYLRARMPRFTAALGDSYADLFAAVDGAEAVDEEPPFTTAAVESGRGLVGSQGKNCISCHTFAGLPSTGPQGMDLAIQHDRLRPGWFRRWLLRSAIVRPGTRMPLFWPAASADDQREVDAIRSWSSLGAAAPVPTGMAPPQGSLVLLPTDRPVLHGAFLKGLSARCIAVGSKERTHYAFDVEHGRLAWLWRGDFLDATGTWHGRAGKLLQPLGQDWIELDDFRVAGSDRRTVLGHRITATGHPVFRVRAGLAEFEDGSVARLSAGGSELVRTLHCTAGTLVIEWQPDAARRSAVRLFLADRPVPATSTLRAGESLEVVYRW